MLDEILHAALTLLGLSKDQVRDIREALEAEVVADDGRYAARTALKHPEGSTTPLNEAADRAQQTYARVRERAVAALPKMMALILAEQVARAQRDEAIGARDHHWDAEWERRSAGPHPETRDLFARLFRHGVTPWHLKALRDEEVAILADLIRWKANDPRHKNGATPWRHALQLYSGRLVLRAGMGVQVKRSVPGLPVRTKGRAPTKHYMFNEMIETHWGASTSAQPVPPEAEASSKGMSAVAESAPSSVAADATAPVVEVQLDPSSCAVGGVPEATQAVQDGAKEVSQKALVVAEAVYDALPDKLGVYWPDIGISRVDYDPTRLIPALEQCVTSSDTWMGAERFLEAAQIGRAREFIEDRRRSGIASFAARLTNGELSALRDAEAAGFDVAAWDVTARLATAAHAVLPPVSIPAHRSAGRAR